MDFTQMPVSQGYKYLFVMIDTFTGWIEGFPIRTEKVVKKLLPEIILRFGLPRSLPSDNGISFISKVTQEVSKALKESESEVCSVVSDSLQPHGLYSPWNSPKYWIG